MTPPTRAMVAKANHWSMYEKCGPASTIGNGSRRGTESVRAEESDVITTWTAVNGCWIRVRTALCERTRIGRNVSVERDGVRLTPAPAIHSAAVGGVHPATCDEHERVVAGAFERREEVHAG
jgi:hypothetical protein